MTKHTMDWHVHVQSDGKCFGLHLGFLLLLPKVVGSSLLVG